MQSLKRIVGILICLLMISTQCFAGVKVSPDKLYDLGIQAYKELKFKTSAYL